MLIGSASLVAEQTEAFTKRHPAAFAKSFLPLPMSWLWLNMMNHTNWLILEVSPKKKRHSQICCPILVFEFETCRTSHFRPKNPKIIPPHDRWLTLLQWKKKHQNTKTKTWPLRGLQSCWPSPRYQDVFAPIPLLDLLKLERIKVQLHPACLAHVTHLTIVKWWRKAQNNKTPCFFFLGGEEECVGIVVFGGKLGGFSCARNLLDAYFVLWRFSQKPVHSEVLTTILRDTPWEKKQRTNYFTSSDPHHDISKQPH